MKRSKLLTIPRAATRMLLATLLLTMTAQTAWATIGGTGTQSDPYTINSVDDWNTLASNVNNGTESYSGKTVKLTADIGTAQDPITATVGTVSGSTQGNAFAGIFDGSGHTIHVNITNTSDQGTALFRYISGATIKNVKVTGTVNGTMHCAGLVGFAASSTTCAIKNCEVATSVTCGGNNHSHCGGILGHGLSSTTTISNCLFSGSISGTTSATGIIYGWGDDGGTHSIVNCLSAGNYSGCSGVELLKKDKGTESITNCYRKTNGGSQGTDASSMNATDLATALNNGGEEWQVVGDNVVPIIQQDPNNLKYATITGVISFYSYTGSAITITPTVTAYGGTALTLGNDFSATLNNENVGSFPFTVTDEGDYTLTITGMGSYSGSQTVTFSVSECPEGLSIDNDFTKGQDGFYYVNMPITGTNTLTFSNSNITTFKVYDDGGKNSNYSNKCNGYLILTAPTGYVLQLSGSINTESCDNLTVYDGSTTSDTKLLDAVYSSTYMVQSFINTVSTGNSMMLYFKSDGSDNYRGLDLTMTLVGDDTEYNITVINPETGGSVAASVGGNPATTAKVSNEVTLTATPPSGYMVSDIYVKDENNIPVAVSGGWYSNNQATFIMPGSAVTVTPTFTCAKTAADGLYINMPKTGIKTATIPAGVQSFKVYDDGGDERNYSSNCDGTLVLTAPTGYEVQLSGSITTEKDIDKLTVYNGSTTSDAKLLDGVSSSSNGTSTAISTVTSTGHSMRLYFSSDASYQAAGLNLTVTLIPITYTVSFNANGGTGDAMAAQNYTYDTAQNLTANTYTRTGYTFAGWATTADGDVVYTDQAEMSNLTTTQGANVELFAKWTAIEYTITYNGVNGATFETANPTTYTIESAAITLNNPTREGYTFAGWTGTGLTDATTTVTIAHGSTGNREYTATWNIITYDITYNGVEGATNPNPAGYTIESEAITLDTPTKDGYTFAGWFDNAEFTGYAVTTIAAGSTGDKTLWAKWIQDMTYGGVTIKDNGTTKSATLDASQEGTISITSDVVVNAVELNRDFTANQPATVMLPFSLSDGQTVNGGSFYKFSGVTKDDDVWKALFTEDATLKANTPYLFMPSATGQMTFNLNGGTVTLNTTTAGEAGSTASNWEFRGTYQKVQWDGSASDPSDLSKTYGFAKGDATIAAGQFVHFAAGAWLKPMRCYLVYNGSTEDGTFQNAPSRTRGAGSTEELPQTITVVLLSSSGETTAIGTLDTKTGDITLDGWYTMDGRKLEGKPTKKGLYINNGRKIVIK